MSARIDDQFALLNKFNLNLNSAEANLIKSRKTGELLPSPRRIKRVKDKDKN